MICGDLARPQNQPFFRSELTISENCVLQHGVCQSFAFWETTKRRSVFQLMAAIGKAGGQTGYSTAEGGRLVLLRVGDWLTPPIHPAMRNSWKCKKYTAFDRETHRKGTRLACCSGVAGPLLLGSCSTYPQPPSPTRRIGFCVIWVSISPRRFGG